MLDKKFRDLQRKHRNYFLFPSAGNTAEVIYVYHRCPA